MKKQCCIFVLLLFPCFIQAQNVGIGTATPHPNAVLDIKGINKGLLIPRGDAAARAVLNTNTAKGLLICDTVTNTIWIHNGNGLSSGWQSLSVGANYWVLNGALGTEIQNTNTGGFWSNNATTVMTDPGVINPPVSGAGTRLMWMPQKSAFRVGSVIGTAWDANNIGVWSFASGVDTRASGKFSFASGYSTIASGDNSFASGSGTTASGNISFASGTATSASGSFSFAGGSGTIARSFTSMAIGRYNDSTSLSQTSWVATDPAFYIGNGTSNAARHNAMVVYKNGNMVLKNPTEVTTDPVSYTVPVSGAGTRMMWLPEKSAFRAGTVSTTDWDAANIGAWSFASGLDARASGAASFASNLGTIASGDNSFASGYSIANGYTSFASGGQTTASGDYSFAAGRNTAAHAYNSMGIGRYNDSIISSSPYTWVATDPLFYIGNGSNNASRHNAMVVYKNGNMVLKNPTTVTTDPVGFTVPISGAGTRMMWLPEKSAFRVGTVVGSQWDAVNIGLWSFATGLNTTASGYSSTALGASTVASGDFSTATGYLTNASGNFSTATGYVTNASGFASTAMGNFTNASGIYSTAMGNGTVSKAYSSVAIGQYNDSIASSSKTNWIPTDPLFYIGNGTSDAARNNAMVVYKNGNMVLKNPTYVNSDPVLYTVPESGIGTIMMWLPEKSAFRMGTVNGTQWDAGNIGLFSTAIGFNTIASGLYATAMGNGTIASGIYSIATGALTRADGARSTAMGDGTNASGYSSTAMGDLTMAVGLSSTAMGSDTRAIGNFSTSMGFSTGAYGISSTAMGDATIANGRNSTSMGFSTSASSFSSVSMGQYNDAVSGSNALTWVATDPLLILGNGTSNVARSNALIVLKNGNTGIGTSTPGTNKLDVNGNTQTDSLQVGSGTKFTKMQAGTLVAGSSGAQSKSVTILFPVAFSTTPKIIVTARNEAGTNNNDTYAVTVRAISAGLAVINIFRVDFASGWSQNLQLDWQAWTQ
jgi:hypothetical protein